MEPTDNRGNDSGRINQVFLLCGRQQRQPRVCEHQGLAERNKELFVVCILPNKGLGDLESANITMNIPLHTRGIRSFF